MEHHSTQAMALAASTVPPRAPTSVTGGSGSGGAAASQGGSSAPPAKSHRSRHGGKGFGSQGSYGQASGGQGSQSGTSSTAQNRTTPSWPSFYNPWTGTIQMWPGPRPPLAPLPARPPQQALLAQQHPQQPATPPRALGACWPVVSTAPRLLPLVGWSLVLGSAISGIDIQHHGAESAPADQRVVLRLRCYLSHLLPVLFHIFSHAVSYPLFNCCR